MARELRASRYLTAANDPLSRFIVEDLPYLDFDATLDFYADTERWIDDNGRALLNANDRFYLLTATCKRHDAWHPWLFERCREVEAGPDGHLDLWARYHYKAVVLDELVPTPKGWRRHGDLTPGDHVFGPDGKPCLVIARTPVFTDADCYRVTFDKGYSVVVSGDHLWTVDVHSRARTEGNQREGRRQETINTRDLLVMVERAAATKSKVLPSVPVSAPLRHRARNLPIHPYALGAWLGDGTTGHATITCGFDDADEMQALLSATGIKVARRSHSNAVTLTLGNGKRGNRYSSEVANALRRLGVYKSKRIPATYQSASVEQRRSLLRGLMDTDGHCDARGTATFVNSNGLLAGDVFDLAAGLGLKPSLRQHHGVVDGTPYPFWHVSFQAQPDAKVFGLKRKLSRSSKVKPGRSSRHAIVSVKPVDSVPCSCIQVDRPDGLYLIGRHLVTTHNSSIGTFAGILQEIIVDPEITVAIMSGTNKVAIPFLVQLQEEMESNEDLKRIHSDVFWQEPRKEAPQWSREKGLVVKRKGNPKESTVEAFGLIDGMRTGKHYRLLDYDDLIDESMVDNPDMVKKVTQRWELSDNLGQLSGTRKWHFGTRYSYGDTYGIILDRGVLKERRYPATENGALNGKPIMLTEARWAEIKTTQKSTVAAQMLLNPLAGSENSFTMSSIRQYDIIPSVMNVYIMCDPSKGRGARSDRTAIIVIGVDVAGNKYLLDGFAHRMRLSERYQKLKQLEAKWREYPGVQLVRVGYEQYGMQTDLETIEENMQRENVFFAIEEMNSSKDGSGKHSKADRISRLEPDMNRSAFYVPAVVYHPDHGGPHNNSTMWNVWTEADHKRAEEAGMAKIPAVDTIIHRPMQGPTRQQRYMEAMHQTFRIVTAIKRVDEQSNLYDLTRMFLEEMRLHPFAPHDDILDAASRVYDLEPKSPVALEALSTEPTIHPDS